MMLSARRAIAHLSIGIREQMRCLSAAVGESTVPDRIEKCINQVTLLGRAGGDPQRRGNEEHPVVIFSLATHQNYKYETGDLMQKTD